MVHLELSPIIIFLWHLASACWARRLYLSPSLRETQIIVWLCVNSVWKSTICKSYFYGERTPSGEASLHLRRQLTNYTSNYWYVLCESMSSWLQVTKTSHRAIRPVCLRCAAESYFFGKPYYLLLAACGRRLEDSNLVDPASSHMLVSKTKPCMSKYKWYTMKLRMAH